MKIENQFRSNKHFVPTCTEMQKGTVNCWKCHQRFEINHKLVKLANSKLKCTEHNSKQNVSNYLNRKKIVSRP